MKAFFKTKWGIACIVMAVLVGLIGGAFASQAIWLYYQTKFQDVTVELGTDTVHITQFLTKYAKQEKVRFVSDVSTIDLTRVGDISLTLKHGRKEETVLLRVQDTTPPEAVFTLHRTEAAGYVPAPEDFVTEVTDLSETTVSFKEQPVVPDDYTDLPVTLVVADAYGNAIEQVCTVTYSWMREHVELELGETLKKAHILLQPGKDHKRIDQAKLNEINKAGVGEYTVTCSIGDRTATCTVTVKDTTAPTVELEPVQVYVGGSAKMEDFVISAGDLSGEVELELLSELDSSKEGSYPVQIEATDIYGNVIIAETTLYVITDTEPPYIDGLSTMTVEKKNNPDYLTGVSAYDEKDGYCSVTCDASGVDLTKAGTYYVVYTAVDQSGNVGSYRRKVIVNHDQEDTQALVDSIAAKIGSDPEALRDYVRYNVSYDTTWGDDDPVWYGFTQWTGNCYVHAFCLRALLDYYGYETKLIWVTDKTHYWLQIKLNGAWKHIDATPGNTHTRYSLMNDAQRLETLNGRTWDTTLWPACE